MLKIYYGVDRVQNSERILQDICENAKAGRGGQILIVPEQYSHEAERALCACGGDCISRYAEVLSFSRLAQRLFSIYGGACREYLDGGGHFLCVCRAADQVKSRLKYFAAVMTKPEFLLQLGTVLEEFLADCLTPEDLQNAAKRQQGQFAQKLTELAILFESYLEVTNGSGRSVPVSRLHQLKTLLAREDYCADKTFYFDGFSDFTAIEQQIAEEILKHAQSVTVALRTDGSSLPAYRTVTETEKMLIKTADRLNVPVQKQQLPVSEKRAAPIARTVQELFLSRKTEDPEPTEAICLHTAADTFSECSFCAQKVQELIKRGYRYRDICIAVTDSAYFQPLRQIFEKAQMPAYFSGSTGVLQKPLFAALLCALRATERMDFESVMAYLKSGLSPLDADAVCRLEHYAFIWNVRAGGWEKPFTMHPQGYGAAWEPAYEQELAQLELWRDAAIAPLSALKASLRGAKNVLQMLTAVGDFLETVKLSETLQEQEEAYLRDDMRQKAQQTRQLYDILLDAMEQMAQILGDAVMPPEQFAQVFSSLLTQYQVSTIPSSVDELQIGSIDSFRHKTAKALLVLGAKDGALPAFSQSVGILTDEERRSLLLEGLSLAPAQIDRFEREMGDVHAALSLPREVLLLSYSGDSPSYLYEKLRAAFPNCKKTDADDLYFAPDAMTAAAAACASAQSVQITSPVVLQAIRDLSQKTRYDFTPITSSTVQGLYGDTVRLSASKIDCFTGCRFAFFLKYGLRAQPWEKVSFDAPAFGTFVHYVLECTVREVMASGGFAETDDAQVLRIAERHAKQYQQTCLPDLLTGAERYGYLYRRNLQELNEVVLDVAAELRLSAFTPVNEELKFDVGGALPPITVSGKLGKSAIRGSIDRVDLYEENGQYYCRVVDYKTGPKELNFAELQKGHGLQMLIYLFALKNSGLTYYGKPLIPAGVLYVPAKTDFVSLKPEDDAAKKEKERVEKRRRKGLVLRDEKVLHAMEQQETKQFLPIKDSETADRAQLKLLEDYVGRTLAGLTDEIYGGRMTPNPIREGKDKGACVYCKYASVCHKDFAEHNYRDIKKIDADVFWANLEGGNPNG